MSPSPTWRLAILSVGTFVLGIDGFVLPGLLPEISSDLSVSVAAAGQLTTAFGIAYAVGSPITATLTGRMDRRVVICTGMVVFLLGMVLQAAGPTYGVVMTGQIVAALGAAAFQANAFAVAGVLAPPDRRSRAFGMIAAGVSLAAVLGLPFGLLIGQLWGWRGTLWTIAALAAVTAVMAGLFVPSVTLPATTMRDRLAVLVNPRILALLTVSALVLTPQYLLGSYASAVVGVSSPGNATAILIALSVYGTGVFVGNRLVSLFADRFASLAVIVTGLGVVALCSGLLAVVQHWFLPTLAALFILGTVGLSLVVPQQNRVFVAGGDVAVIALSLNGAMNHIGAAIGAGIGGVVLANAGPLWLAPTAAVLALGVIAVAMITAPDSLGNKPTNATPGRSRDVRAW
ncbi:MFS transporter [Streptomyces bluensis]|uniref:MFS transporter n=1 Tax=Streptomyces bluensis TaxID=33897 RepID=UPI0016787555|nr:MFS transporter [Streptomyces bluensis]GGZ64300.1 MFS transporter [Streptomyces bluensis]